MDERICMEEGWKGELFYAVYIYVCEYVNPVEKEKQKRTTGTEFNLPKRLRAAIFVTGDFSTRNSVWTFMTGYAHIYVHCYCYYIVIQAAAIFTCSGKGQTALASSSLQQIKKKKRNPHKVAAVPPAKSRCFLLLSFRQPSRRLIRW